MSLARIRAVNGAHPGHWLRHIRPSRRALSVLSVAAVLTLGIAIPAIAVTGSPSGFESADGNLVLDHSGNTDWNCFVNSDGFAHNGATPSGCAVTSGATQLTADKSGEVKWVSGQKFDTQCPALSTGNSPAKDDFTNVASFNDTNSALDTFFYGSTIRSSTNGNSSGDVEFDQAKGNGTTTFGCRTAGDRLLAYDFLNGGTSLDFHLITWIDSTNPTAGGNNGTCLVKTDSMPCWGANVVTVSPTLFDGQANQSAITAADNGMSNAALAINQFAEFGINLTQALGLAGKCFSFPQQVWESRTSGSSFTSNPEDIEIQQTQIQNCGEIKIIKQTDPRGQNKDFSFTSTIGSPGTSNPPTPNCTQSFANPSSFTLNDSGNAGKTPGSTDPAQNSPGNTQDCTNVIQGSYTVSEGAEPAAFSFESLTCSADSVSGSSVSPTSSTTTETATITLKPGGLVTCVFVNQLHQGAIMITKTGKYEGCQGKTAGSQITVGGSVVGVCTGTGSTADLKGAAFTITDSLGNPVSGSPATTGDNGTVCVDGLSWAGNGTNYLVSEQSPPTGYSEDPANTDPSTVTVTQNAKCSDSNIAAEAATVSFNDLPLTNISASASAVLQGATSSTISCVNTTPADVGNSPQGPGSSVTVTANGLKPGTYTCTIIIDP
jgi:hypothetical protein